MFVRCLRGVCEVFLKCLWGVCEVQCLLFVGCFGVFVRCLCVVFVRCL